MIMMKQNSHTENIIKVDGCHVDPSMNGNSSIIHGLLGNDGHGGGEEYGENKGDREDKVVEGKHAVKVTKRKNKKQDPNNETTKKRKYGSKSVEHNSCIPIHEESECKRSSQSCDRCRLKKIKCMPNDPSLSNIKQTFTNTGLACCLNCLSIGYKCEYSDKLTRRGFPKGYTGMLENKVVELQKKLDLLSANTFNAGNGNTSNISTGHVVGSKADGEGIHETQESIPTVDNNIKNYINYFSNENNLYMGTMPLDYLFAERDNKWDAVYPHTNTLRADNKKRNKQAKNKSNEHTKDTGYSGFIEEMLLKEFTMSYKSLVPESLADVVFSNSQIIVLIEQLIECELILIPVLYPKQGWKEYCIESLMHHNTNTKGFSNSTLQDGKLNSQEPRDYVFLGFLVLVYQWFFKRFDDSKVFQLLNLIGLNYNTSKSLQLMLLATYYASTLPMESTFKFELVHASYKKLLDLGIYLPDSNIDKQNLFSNTPCWLDEELQLMIFYSFEFLQNWINLTSGKPKVEYHLENFYSSNMIVNNLRNLNGKVPQYLKSFVLLCGFIIEDLNGLDLNENLSWNNNNVNTNISMISGHETENRTMTILKNFKKTLLKYNLYHTIEEHLFLDDDDEISHKNILNDGYHASHNYKSSGKHNESPVNMLSYNSSSTSISSSNSVMEEKVFRDQNNMDSKLMQLRFLNTNIDSSQYMEVQITLYYFLTKMFVLKSNNNTNFEIMKNILSLYYIVYTNNFSCTAAGSSCKVPSFFKILNILPIDNISIIKYCLDMLKTNLHNNETNYIYTIWENIIAKIPVEYETYYNGTYAIDSNAEKELKKYKKHNLTGSTLNYTMEKGIAQPTPMSANKIHLKSKTLTTYQEIKTTTATPRMLISNKQSWKMENPENQNSNSNISTSPYIGPEGFN